MRTIVLLFLILPIYALSQVFDDFSDGDFSEDPTWSGCDTSFIVNTNLQLQSAATASGDRWLSTPIPSWEGPSVAGTVEWRFWIRESFSPSAKNYADVWLCADTAVLPSASMGYFLRFGAVGSLDAIELYRKDPGGEQLVCRGAEAAIASSFKVSVRVQRDTLGHWCLATDYLQSGVYALEAEGFDDTYSPEGWFGFQIKFTASNARKFYFDDVYVGPEIVDTEPPSLLRLEALEPHHLLLTFSEAMGAEVLDTGHYSVAPGVGAPDTAYFGAQPSMVVLGFDDPLPQNTPLTLLVMDVADLSGNLLPEWSGGFALYEAGENDVVINEVMADPSPVVGLPEWEYVELFNTTEFTIDLKDWVFLIGTTAKTLPAVQIGPLDYLLLCKVDAEGELGAYGQTCGFSSFSIANAGATLRLLSPDETLVSEVSFNDHWYHDAEKKNGGWSLEQIDPFNPCAGTVNWSASTDAEGGTPGRLNSIDAPNATHPQVARVNVLGDRIVMLWFDQQMDRASLADSSHYWVEELGVTPLEVVCNPVESSSLELVFEEGFEEGMVYTLVLNGVESCSGQPIEPDTKVSFGIPNPIGAGEVLINEILFDPISPGVDYVELYNHSDKTFDLSELKLGVIHESFPNPVDTVLKEITADSRLFLPGTYVLLSTDGYTVAQQYACGMECFFDMESFPSYSNAGGVALLMSRQGVLVDRMPFSEQMHYPLLKETKGVALERVSWEVSSERSDNWHSAAEAVRFGTPGYRNSMMQEAVAGGESTPIEVSPTVFSPDGDGSDDHCVIRYHLATSGLTMNTYVFSAEGRLVRHLVRGALVGQEGSLVWNGTDGRGLQVPMGIYVVVTEVFDFEGVVRRYKNAVAVASR